MTKPDEAPRLGEWLTATEIADLLGVSRQTVNQMIRAGDFATLHVIGPATKPQYLAQRDEVQKLKSTRTFPRARRS